MRVALHIVLLSLICLSLACSCIGGSRRRFNYGPKGERIYDDDGRHLEVIRALRLGKLSIIFHESLDPVTSKRETIDEDVYRFFYWAMVIAFSASAIAFVAAGMLKEWKSLGLLSLLAFTVGMIATLMMYQVHWFFYFALALPIGGLAWFLWRVRGFDIINWLKGKRHGNYLASTEADPAAPAQ